MRISNRLGGVLVLAALLAVSPAEVANAGRRPAVGAGVTRGSLDAISQSIKAKDEGMNPEVVEQTEFTIVGIAVRTSNAKEMTGEGVIGKQWARFMQENLPARIQHKADQKIVAVYTDYASDHTGEYTFLLGARATSDADIPAGMVAKKVPAGKFARFTSEKGPAAQVVPALWMKINSLPKTAEGGDRTYRADYEIYDERASDPQKIVMDAYVGIR